MKPRTIGDILDFLCPDFMSMAPHWPPDAFAIAATILEQSGAYIKVVTDWPPRKIPGRISRVRPSQWPNIIGRIGKNWRSLAPSGNMPQVVKRWWKDIVDSRDIPLDEISSSQRTYHALLQIVAASDEACGAVGIRVPASKQDEFWRRAFETLYESHPRSTLCRQVPSNSVQVLPKFHTPQSGITLRSLTHHLALSLGTEANAVWTTFPELPGVEPLEHKLNLLVIPWPYVVTPAMFRAIKSAGAPMPKGFGFFKFDMPAVQEGLVNRIRGLIAEAQKVVGEIDGIVLPELSMRETDFKKLCEKAFSDSEKRVWFAIAGIESQAPRGGFPGNSASVRIAFFDVDDGRLAAQYGDLQRKNHRWKLDRSQILTYGLGSRLNTAQTWWEGIELFQRSVNFFSIGTWFNFCVLICEDLARSEPLPSKIRSVGPNLIFALLMDGPQLTTRWPARFATVLAEDPGSSVLTLTSLGMAKLSRPDNKGALRTVALWRDGGAGSAREINLPAGKDALVMTITREFQKEWTADGRHDNSKAHYLKLTGIHAIADPLRARH